MNSFKARSKNMPIVRLIGLQHQFTTPGGFSLASASLQNYPKCKIVARDSSYHEER